jgi:hypothetical protein
MEQLIDSIKPNDLRMIFFIRFNHETVILKTSIKIVCLSKFLFHRLQNIHSNHKYCWQTIMSINESEHKFSRSQMCFH